MNNTPQHPPLTHPMTPAHALDIQRHMDIHQLASHTTQARCTRRTNMPLATWDSAQTQLRQEEPNGKARPQDQQTPWQTPISRSMASLTTILSQAPPHICAQWWSPTSNRQQIPRTISENAPKRGSHSCTLMFWHCRYHPRWSRNIRSHSQPPIRKVPWPQWHNQQWYQSLEWWPQTQSYPMANHRQHCPRGLPNRRTSNATSL